MRWCDCFFNDDRSLWMNFQIRATWVKVTVSRPHYDTHNPSQRWKEGRTGRREELRGSKATVRGKGRCRMLVGDRERIWDLGVVSTIDALAG